MFRTRTLLLTALSLNALVETVAGQELRGTPPPPPVKPSDPLNRTTPQSAVFSFLETCRSRDYAKAARYLDLTKVPERRRPEEGRRLAAELGQALDRNAQFDVAALSRDSEGDREDGLPVNRERVGSFSLTSGKVDLQLERSDLRADVPIWRFSSDSVELVPKLAQSASPSWIERNLPEILMRWTLVNTPIWRWIALVLLAAALAALAKLTARMMHWLANCVLRRAAPRGRLETADAVVGPLQLLFSAALFGACMEWIGLSAVLRFYLRRGLAILTISGFGWLCMRVVDLLIVRVRTAFEEKHRTFSRSILPMASRVVKVLILVFAVAAVLSSLGYNTTTILAGLGLGGIAIALAAQKTMENLFGGVSLITDRPVYVGDFCKFGETVGTVEDIGLRSTRIRTLDRSLVTVPNSQISSMALENFSRKDKHLFHPKLNLRQDTQPGQVREILQSMERILKENPKVETGGFPVRFVGVGEYSLDVEILAYVLTSDGDEFLRIQQELYLRMLDAVAEAGTALALPAQTSIACSEPGDAAQKPALAHSPRGR